MAEKFKRRNFIIDPNFQLKFSGMVALVILISSSIYPLIIYHVYDSFLIYMAKVQPTLATKLSMERENIIYSLIAWQMIYVALTFIIFIFFSHKIAGPMFKLKKYLKEYRENTANGKLFFRKADHFHDVATELNITLEKLSDDYKKDFMYLSEISSYMNNLSMVVPDDKKAVLNEINVKLSEMQSRFNGL